MPVFYELKDNELKELSSVGDTRTFGMEIEYEFEDYDDLEYFEELSEDYSDTVYDGSLDYGKEVVSAPMTRDALIKWLETSHVLEFGDDNSDEYADTNGIHIHYGLQSLRRSKRESQARAILLSSVLSEEIGETFRFSEWCLPNVIDLSDSSQDVNYGSSAGEPSPFLDIDNDYEINFIQHLTSYGRYRNINTQTGKGTFEFRMFPFTFDFRERVHYIDFVNDFMDIVDGYMTIKDILESHFTIDRGNFSIHIEQGVYDVSNLEHSQFKKAWENVECYDSERINLYVNNFKKLKKEIKEFKTKEPIYEVRFGETLKVMKDTDFWGPLEEGYTLTNVSLGTAEHIGTSLNSRLEGIINSLMRFPELENYGYNVEDVKKLLDELESIETVVNVGDVIRNINGYANSYTVEKVMYNYERHGVYIVLKDNHTGETRKMISDTDANSVIYAKYNEQIYRIKELALKYDNAINKYSDYKYYLELTESYKESFDEITINIESYTEQYFKNREGER